MASGPNLQDKLESIFSSLKVYNQPPESSSMEYPAIKYNLDGIDTRHANNKVYTASARYLLTFMDYDPGNSLIYAGIMFKEFPKCKFQTAFAKDGLNHTIFALYY